MVDLKKYIYLKTEVELKLFERKLECENWNLKN